MGREKNLTPKQADILARLVAKNGTLQDPDQTLTLSTGSIPDNGKVMVAEPTANLGEGSLKCQQPDKRFSGTAVAAEAALRDVGFDESVLETLSNKQKLKWATIETEPAAVRQKLNNFRTKDAGQEKKGLLLASSAAKWVNGSNTGNDTAVLPGEDSESEESGEEEGWEYAIGWQAIEQPNNPADAVPLTAAVAKPDTTQEESESEEEQDGAVEAPGGQDQSAAAGLPGVDTQMVTQDRFPNRQKPDSELLRQMQRKRNEGWSDGDDENENAVHEYVVKAETWGMTNFPADHILVLGRYLERDKAEEMVRSFISSCKPHKVVRSLEIQSVWSDGNFSQKMIRDGKAGYRAFIEAKVVSARQYPGLKEKVVRRKMYAVLFQRTISKPRGDDGSALEEDVTATTVDDMAMFTTKSLANWHAKRLYQDWYREHLSGPQDRCWLGINHENLCKYVEELNEEGLLFGREDSFQKERKTTDTMKVWVKEIAPRGPSN
jgi:hypothetical protein